MSKLTNINLEYVYITIPTEYLTVYHAILTMLADYGEEMLKDCKASCTNKNSDVIDCFNMFNAAIAARKLNNLKLADTIIKYIKAKIKQIYNNNGVYNCIFTLDKSNISLIAVDEDDITNCYVNKANFEYYVGFGLTYDDIIVSDNLHDCNEESITNEYKLVINDNDYLYIILPTWIELFSVTYNGILITFDSTTQITINDVVYNVYKSNTNFEPDENAIVHLIASKANYFIFKGYGDNIDINNNTNNNGTSLNISSGPTSERPTISTNSIGHLYYDTTLNALICWTGNNWVDTNGNLVM